VTASNLLYPAVTQVQTVSFTTSHPPTGGTAYITPDTGFINST
jgi:hypothetical protein